tara:strand:+ start:1811 stop:1954 length:144 start_codon:yes stop_codon:yes gene_type:complete
MEIGIYLIPMLSFSYCGITRGKVKAGARHKAQGTRHKSEGSRDRDKG